MRTATAAIRADPNVTPMIDVMLVLLIIFMVVTPLLVTGFRAEPPRGIHLTSHPDEPSDAVIGVDQAGRYYYDKQPVSEPVLVARLTERFASATDDHVVYIRADRAVKYARIDDAMRIAATAGARVIGLVSEVPPQPTGGERNP